MHDETSVFLCNTFKAAGVCTDMSSCCARFNPRNPKTCSHVWEARSISTVAVITPFIITGKNIKAEIIVGLCNFWNSLNKPCITKHVCQEKHTNLRLQLSNKCSLQMSFFVIYCTQDIFINSPVLLVMIVLFPLSCMTYILLRKWANNAQKLLGEKQLGVLRVKDNKYFLPLEKKKKTYCFLINTTCYKMRQLPLLWRKNINFSFKA